MTSESPAQVALDVARKRVERLTKDGRIDPESLIRLADVEVRAEQARQQELANMIALAANPNANPFPIQDVLARIKELTKLR